MKRKKTNPGLYVSFLFLMAVCVGSPLPLLPQAAAMTVEVSVDPPTVGANQPTEILVMAAAGPGSPIANAYIIITTGGGIFLDSGDTTIEGKTDANGGFGTRWKCEECASAYVFNIEVMKPGFKSWRGEAKVEVAASVSQNKGKEIFASVNFDPPIVSESQPILITVETFTDEGSPVKDAQVKTSTGGGIFTDTGTFTAEGSTDINGIFETPWKCIKCAEEYVFSIEVNKPGMKGWTGEARILSGEQPPPLHKGDINLKTSVIPSTPSPGQKVEIRIEALSDRGDPIPDANIRIDAGGGLFANSNDSIIEGITGKDGIFTATWNCRPCAAATYQFSIEADKPGFNEGTAKTVVKIK